MKRPPPETDIGPYYKILGAAGLLGVIGFMLWGRKDGVPLTWVDFAVMAVVALLVLALIRPTGFDNTIKRVATWLPFTKYTGGKPDA